MFSWEQMLSASNRSRISQANMVGFSCLYLTIASTTAGVATFGLEPPITPGLVDPVSKYLEEEDHHCSPTVSSVITSPVLCVSTVV